MAAVIGIRYNESGREQDLGYKCVYLHYGNSEEKEFSSGDFVKDWFDCKMFAVKEGILEKEVYISQSSSVDHFIMDGAKFDSAYLHFENDVPILKYVDKSDPYWFISQQDVFEKGWEHFVDENTKPTWNELKTRCGHEPLKNKN